MDWIGHGLDMDRRVTWLRFSALGCTWRPMSANRNLAGSINGTMLDNIVGNGLAHSVGGAVFCGCLCCENGWIFGKT